MSLPPSNRPVRIEDYRDPDSAIRALVDAFNDFQSSTIACLSGGVSETNLARSIRTGVQFRTDTEGAAQVRVAHGLSSPPQSVFLGKLCRRNGATLGADWGWSFEWVATGSEVLLAFVDLPLSVDLVATVVME